MAHICCICCICAGNQKRFPPKPNYRIYSRYLLRNCTLYGSISLPPRFLCCVPMFHVSPNSRNDGLRNSSRLWSCLIFYYSVDRGQGSPSRLVVATRRPAQHATWNGRVSERQSVRDAKHWTSSTTRILLFRTRYLIPQQKSILCDRWRAPCDAHADTVVVSPASHISSLPPSRCNWSQIRCRCREGAVM